MMKMPMAAMRIHLMYEEDRRLLRSVEYPALKSLVIANMLHPRTSVVIAVDRAFTVYCEVNIRFMMVAPRVPIRYPMMLLMIMIAAVNSMLIPFL